MSDRAPSPAPPLVPPAEPKVEPADPQLSIKEEESSPLPSPTSSVAQAEPTSSPPIKLRRTEAQKRALLRDDPLVQEMDPHRILCRGCQRWIKLSSTQRYMLSNWYTHKQRCAASTSTPRSVRRTPSKPKFSPGSRVATAERKIVLLNDPQVRSCIPNHVECGTCKSVVALEGEVDYDLTKWTEHKGKCIPMTPAPITAQGSTSHQPRALTPPSTSSAHSQASADRSPQSLTSVSLSLSTSSTETTAATESSPTAIKVGMKRGREEETEDKETVAEDERPTSRSRTERYRPPEEEESKPFGWFMQPLKEFARGFREGLGST